MTRESSIVRAIRAYLDPLRGPIYYEKRWGGPYSTIGAPDLSLCVAGRRVELEVKTAAGRVSPHQAFQLDRWRRAGAVVAVVRSVDDVRAIVEPLLAEVRDAE